MNCTNALEKNATVISLKKYLDMDPASERAANELLALALQSYRSLLLAMAKSGVRACPPVGADLEKNLTNLGNRLSDEITPDLLSKTENLAEEQLEQWAGRNAEYFRSKANEVKELLVVMARTAESIVERDQRYASQFTQLSGRLQSMADLEDLPQLRGYLLQNATELKSCVERMTQDSQQSVAQLQTEVSSYETKLKAVEQLAMQDTLTGLANRRNVEERIQWRIAHQQTFSIVMLDLNEFKKVNDTYGHLAGDNLLKQFAEELRTNSRTPDIVGRWGGDEFIAVIDCDFSGAKSKVDRLQKWVLGEYTLQVGNGEKTVKIAVNASIGIAQWQAGETMQEVIDHADSVMYRDKHLARKQSAGN
jgi:diguanylate cyclase (GGDEF)-like protein